MIVAYLGICLGVILAVVYPVLRGVITKAFPGPTASPGFVPPWLKKYLALGALSLIAGLLVLAIWAQANPGVVPSFLTAVLLGFAWESTVEKVIRTPPL